MSPLGKPWADGQITLPSIPSHQGRGSWERSAAFHPKRTFAEVSRKRGAGAPKARVRPLTAPDARSGAGMTVFLG